MSCKHPILAVKSGINHEGKNVLWFPLGFKPYQRLKHSNISIEDYWNLYGRDNVLLIPCGKCVSCKLSYTKTWAYRCAAEASLYDNNTFLTLTYDDEHLPTSEYKREMQLFMKRLRREYGDGIRFYGCGEFGSKNNRFHMHLILFNFWPDDAKPVGRSNTGAVLLASDTIGKLWKNGAHMIGEVNLATCSYVARYVTKKVYGFKDDSYTLMSRRPGIGYGYFKKNCAAITRTDKIYTAEGYCTMPRYFESLLEKTDPAKLEEIKNERLSKNNVKTLGVLNLHGWSMEEENWHAGEIDEDSLKRKKRGL